MLTYGGVRWTPSFVAALAYTVLLANMLAWTLWFFALRSLPAGLAGREPAVRPASRSGQQEPGF